MRTIFAIALFICSLEFSEGDLKSRLSLMQHLKEGYVRYAHPENVTLEIGVSLLCATYDDESHELVSRVYERYSWTDSRLSWDPAEYGNVDKLSLPQELLWTPDVKLFDAVGESEERDSVNVVVLSSGKVYWIVPAAYESMCLPDKEDDDVAHCKYSLGPWTHSVKTLPMKLFERGFDKNMYLDACPYEVTESYSYIKNTKYDCCPEKFPSLEVRFCLKKRKDMHYKGGKHHKKSSHQKKRDHAHRDDDHDHSDNDNELHYQHGQKVIHHDCVFPNC